MMFEISSTDGEVIFAEKYRKKLYERFYFLYNGEYKRHFIEIDSIDALIELYRIVDEELIIGYHHDGTPYIEIYDSWRE